VTRSESAAGAERASLEYEVFSQRFRVAKPAYRQQFNHMYVHRIAKLRPRVIEAAKERWGAVTMDEASGKSEPLLVTEKVRSDRRGGMLLLTIGRRSFVCDPGTLGLWSGPCSRTCRSACPWWRRLPGQ
jgi:hypothetical protein